MDAVLCFGLLAYLSVCLLLDVTLLQRMCSMPHEDCNRFARQCASSCHLLANDDAESGLCFCTNLPCECTMPMKSSCQQEGATLKQQGTQGVNLVRTFAKLTP